MRVLCAVLIAAVFPLVAQVQGAAPAQGSPEAQTAPANQAAPATKEAPGMPLHPEDVFHIGFFHVTNSMVVSWIVALGLILLARMATRHMKEVPEGLQNFWEWLVETLYNFLEGIMGNELTKKTYWFLATIFILILFTNWFGLVPFVGSIGWGVQTPHGFEVTRPLLRGGNADLNMTAAMAIVFFLLWVVWALEANGIKGFFLHIFGPKGESSGFLRLIMVVIFFLMGFIEVISIAFRPVSLSLRLFGNIYAGERMLESMTHMFPALGWIIPIPFYFLELIAGWVQALVFLLLPAVFIVLICQHEEEPRKAHRHH